MSEETREEMMARKVAEGIPKIGGTKDIVDVVGYLFDCCADNLDKDEKESRYYEHLIGYLISAICCLMSRIQTRGHKTEGEIHSLVLGAYGLGRLRESYIDALKGLKDKCVAKYGLVTMNDVEESFKTNDADKEAEGLMKELVDLAKSLGLDIKVVNIPGDNPLANPPKDPTTN